MISSSRESKTEAQPGLPKPPAVGVAKRNQVGGRTQGATPAAKKKAPTTTPRAKQTAQSGRAKAIAPKKDANAGYKTAKAPDREGHAPRAESKGAKIIEMIGRTKGATLAEIMKTTGWQAHSIRGYISTVAKKHRIKITSTRNDAGDRLYGIAK